MSERSLEELFLLAAEEVEYREAFYEKLLNSDIFVLGGEDASEGEVADGELSLLEWESEEGVRAIPFFTKYSYLEEAVGENHLYLQINAAILFASIAGSNAVMNPGFEESKMFSPEELEMILTTEFDSSDDEDEGRAEFSEDVAIRPITKGRSVGMLKAIKEYFRNVPEVKRAYVAAMNHKTNEDESHLVIGVEVDGDEQEIFKDVMNIVLHQGPDDETVDLFKLDLNQKEGMSAYFIHEMKPFYIKKS
jgi:hypothetical protein